MHFILGQTSPMEYPITEVATCTTRFTCMQYNKSFFFFGFSKIEKSKPKMLMHMNILKWQGWLTKLRRMFEH
jgi:hypothetical protein